jgi:two-component system NarL family sensor kinase
VARTVELNRALQRSRDRLVRAREEERRRLRRDLHDGLGPSLASQTFRIDAALALCETQPAAASEHLRALKAQTRELVADIRRLVYELRPPALDELGLGGAVAAYAGQYADAALRVRTATTPDPLGALPAAVEVASYRIITEAITNAARHAQAAACSVEIANNGRTLTIVIADDGVGLPPGVAPGVGLTSMRERVAELGGTLTVASRLGGGTRVEAILPTDPADTSAVLDPAPAQGTDGLGVPQGADDVEASTCAQDPAEDLDAARATDDARA